MCGTTVFTLWVLYSKFGNISSGSISYYSNVDVFHWVMYYVAVEVVFAAIRVSMLTRLVPRLYSVATEFRNSG